MGDKPYGIDTNMTARIAGEVKDAHAKGLEIALVIGAGNIFRGLSAAAGGIERSTADYMGMLATVMNALAMQSALEQIGVDTRVQSAIPMQTVCEPYIRRRAVRHCKKGVSLFLQVEQAILTLQRIQPRPCAQRKWNAMLYLKEHKLMVSMIVTRKRTQMRNGLIR